MSQGAVILPGSPLTGADAAAAMNVAWAAMISLFSGNTAPTLGPGAGGALVKGQFWLDTSLTPNVLKMYDGASWLPYIILDPTRHAVGSYSFLAGSAHNVDFNTVGDTQIPLVLPTPNYIFEAAWIFNKGTTASLTAAKFGIFSAAGGGGTVIVASGTSMAALTSNTVNTLTSATVFGPNNYGAFNFTSMYFRITTAQGAAASGDVHITVRPLP